MDNTLEEMKKLWQETDQRLNEQKSISDKIIIEMTQQRYKNKFSKLSQYEFAGAIVCYLMAIVVLWRFYELDTWYLQIAGILSLSFLLILPTVVLQALTRIKQLNPTKGNFSDVLLQFTKAKRQLLLVQKSGILLNGVFLLIFIPVVSKIMNGDDIFLKMEGVWMWFTPVMLLFLYFFSRWSYKCYKNITGSAESLLYELKD